MKILKKIRSKLRCRSTLDFLLHFNVEIFIIQDFLLDILELFMESEKQM